MPEMPTHSRQIMPSGRVPALPIPYSVARTGAEQIGAGMQRLGGGIEDIGQVLARKEIEKQAIYNEMALSKAISQLKNFEFSKSQEIENANFVHINEYDRWMSQYPNNWESKAKEIAKTLNPTVAAHFEIYAIRAFDGSQIKMADILDSKKKSLLRAEFGVNYRNALEQGNIERLPAIIEAYKSVFKPGEIERITEFENIYFNIRMGNYLNAIELIDKSKMLTNDEQMGLMAQTERLYKDATDEQQEEMARKLLVDLWEGKLTNPQVITDALKAGFITPEAAKSLRAAILKTEDVKLNFDNLVKVKDAISDLRDGKKTRKEALDVLYANLDGIDETTGKSLIGEIYSAQDPDDPLNETTAKNLLGTLVRLRNEGILIGKDPIDMTLDDKAQNEYKWLELTTGLEQWLKNNPTATPEQKQKYFKEVLLKPQQEAVVKSKLRRIAEWSPLWQAARISPFNIAYRLLTSEKKKETVAPISPGAPEQKRLQSAPATELDKLWPNLTDEQKRKVWTAFENGYTPREIIEALEMK